MNAKPAIIYSDEKGNSDLKFFTLIIGLSFIGLGLSGCEKTKQSIGLTLAGIQAEKMRPKDPITRSIDNGPYVSGKGWGAPVDLEPEVIKPGMSVTQVKALITKAHYHLSRKPYTAHYGPGWYLNATRFYSLAYSGFPCEVQYEVAVFEDGDGKLEKVFGSSNQVAISAPSSG